MAMNKAHALSENCQRIFFTLTDTSGTPSITSVFPSHVAGDISVADTAQGRAAITIKNAKGNVGYAHVRAQSLTTSVWSSVVSKSYSGNDLSFEISSENDASTLTDTSVDVEVIAF